MAGKTPDEVLKRDAPAMDAFRFLGFPAARSAERDVDQCAVHCIDECIADGIICGNGFVLIEDQSDRREDHAVGLVVCADRLPGQRNR